MKRIKKLVWLIFLITQGFNSFSQTPITVQVVVNQPYPALFSDVTDNPGQFQIILVNSDFNTSYDVKLQLSIDGYNGISLLLPRSASPSKPIHLKPLGTVILNSKNISEYYEGLTYDDFIINGIEIEDAVESQRIPDGNYEICATAVDYTKNKDLSLPGCTFMNIATLEPPVITSPINDAEVFGGNAQQFIVQWTPVNALVPMYYDVRIVEAPIGVNPYDAMQTDNLLIYEENDIPFPMLNYGPTKPILETDKRYAVQVKAHDRSRKLHIRNDGFSEIVTIFTIENEFPEIDDSYVCGEPCNPPVIEDAPDIDFLDEGDVIKIGHFDLILDQVARNGNQFTGFGRIAPTTFFVAPIRVEFDNLQVNTNGVVYAGEAIAMQNADLIELNIIDENAQFFPNGNPDLADIYQVVSDPQTAVTNYLEDLIDPSLSVGLTLPLGFGDPGNEIQIIQLRFTAQRASASLIDIMDISGVSLEPQFLALGLSDFCMTPGGPSADQENAFLELLDTVSISAEGRYDMQLFPANADRSRGTFAQLNCDGFNRIFIGGVVSFDDRYFIPEDANRTVIPNQRLAATFQNEMVSWEGMVMELNFTSSTELEGLIITPNFRIVQLPDYSFTIGEAYLDCSYDANPDGMSFPDFYSPPSSEDWTGFYIKDFNIKLPDYFKNGENERIEIYGHDIFYDDGKFTFGIEATNLMNENNPGRLDDWDFTIDRFYLRAIREELDSGLMTGIMKFDFTETNVEYVAGFKVVDNDIKYNFELNCDRNLLVPMWYSTIRLKPSSKFYLDIVGDEVDVKLELDGELELDNDVGDIPGVEFESFEFEDLTIQDEPPYFSGGTFRLEGKVGGTVMGYTTTLEDLGLVTPPKTTSGGRSSGSTPNTSTSTAALKAKVAIAFGPDENSFAAKGGFAINAQKNMRTRKWEAESADFESLRIDAKTSSVEVHGLVEIYKNDRIYGDGFRGAVNATFLNDYTATAEVLFGHKSNYDYWYVDGSVKFMPAVPIVGPIGMHGLGGGAYYNMSPNGSYEPAAIGTITDRPSYEPNPEGWGFKAMTVVATTPEASVFSGDLTLDVSFQDGGALDQISFSGNTYIMKSPSLTGGNDKPMITLQGTTRYNNRSGVLNGDFGYQIEIPVGTPLVWGGNLNHKKVRFHVANSRDWYIHMGKPGPTQNSLLDSMLDVNVGYKFDFFGKEMELSAGLYSYFDIGTEMPSPPPLPKEVTDIINVRSFSRDIDASGVMFGLHNKITLPSVDKSIGDIAGVYFNGGGGMGLDVSLLKLENAACNGNPNFGINNWYANGQAYLYGNVKGGAYVDCYFKTFRVDIGIGFAAALQAALPNPTMIGGDVALEVDLPVIGKKSVGGSFELGSACVFTNISDDWAEAFNLNDILVSVTPSATNDINPFYRGNNVIIDFNLPIDEIQEYRLAGDTILKIKVVYDVRLHEYRDGDGSFILSRLFVDELRRRSNSDDQLRFHRLNSTQVKVYLTKGNLDYILNPDRTYKFEVIAQVYYAFNNDAFELLKDKDGNAVEEKKHKVLWTKEVDMQLNNVTSAYPRLNERFNYINDNINTKGHLEYSGFNLTQQLGNDPIIQAHFVEMGASTLSSLRTFGLYKGNNRIEFNIPLLKKGKVYHLIIVATPKQASNVGPLTLYDYYFQTSAYNSRHEKFDDLRISEYEGINYNIARSYKLKLTLKEPLSYAEMDALNLKFKSQTNLVSNESTVWDINRNEIQRHYMLNGLIYPQSPYEFVENRRAFVAYGPLTNDEYESLMPVILQIARSNIRRPVIEYTWNPNIRLFILRQNAINNLNNPTFAPPYLRGNYVPMTENGKITFDINNQSEVSFIFNSRLTNKF